MKSMRSILLTSVAVLALANGVQAADLPSRKSAPADFVKVCNAFGAGYFYIPGTDTCLKIGGRLRAETAYLFSGSSLSPAYTSRGTATKAYAAGALYTGSPAYAVGAALPNYLLIAGNSERSQDRLGFRSLGRIQTDARTQTAYGTLRTFVRFELTAQSGIYGSAGATSANLDKGFIQFAGITAGKAQSMFDFYANDFNYEALSGSDVSNLMLAYTATFGGGFSATLSFEDSKVRSTGVRGIYGGSVLATTTGTTDITTGAERIPDGVANIRVDQGWGSAQLSGALHQDTSISNGYVGKNNISSYGYAVQAGVQIKLPMLAAGDELWIQGAYANGANSYLGIGPGFSGGLSRFHGGLLRNDTDVTAVSDGLGGYKLEKERGFSAVAAFQHYWDASIRSVLFGSYTKVMTGTGTKNTDWAMGGLGSASEYRVGSQLIWSPVRHFDIGIEAVYARLNQTVASVPGTTPTSLVTSVGTIKPNNNAIEARLRLQRDF